MAGRELASVVASYLRKHGFAKTLSAFLRENDDAFQETDIVDLETLYKLYSSTQPNGVTKVKEPKRSKPEDGHIVSEGENVVRDDAEKASDSLHTNGGTFLEGKKKKKGDKKNAPIDLPELDQTGKSAAVKKSKKEEGSKKKKGGEGIEGSDARFEGLKSECEKPLTMVAGTEKRSVKEVYSNGNAIPGNSTLKGSVVENDNADGGGITTHQEPAYYQKSLGKKKKKERKEQEGTLLQADEASGLHETKPVDEAQVLSQDCDPPKKKRKKSKIPVSNEETEDGAVSKSASKVPNAKHTEKCDASEQTVDAMNHPVDSVNEVEGVEISAKRKKHKKELSSQGAEDCLKKPSEPSKKDCIDKEKHSAKKSKGKQNAVVEGNSIQDVTSLGSSPAKLKEVEATADTDTPMHESGSAKTKRKKETPNDKKAPTGALAFKRVEVDKVKFLDPRLSDNSYWAKDGADEGYGAKAQEVLGFVRGRDFRHEKTKKKRGSYRGGLIGLESHSIKFDNSDDD